MKPTKLLFSVVLFCFAASLKAAFPEVPTKTVDWWQIAERAPAPYTFNGEEFNWVAGDACDFTIFRTENGKWHLVSCVRWSYDATSFMEIERFFYHWETDDLRNPRWKRRGIFNLNVNGYRTTMQAPHCFWIENKMYMYFNAAFSTLPWNTYAAIHTGAYSLTSDDGGNSFSYLQPAPPVTGTLRLHEMGRDVMALDDRDGVSGKFISMFLNNHSTTCPAPNGSAYFGARTANNIDGPYTTGCPVNIAGDHEINPESPFMVRRGTGATSNYYLWSQSNTMHSSNPLDFSASEIFPMDNAAGRYAPEVVKWNGEYFYAGYGRGIFLSQMEWVSGKDHNIYLSSLQAAEETLYPAFDKYRDEYTMVVGNNVTALTLQANCESAKSVSVITGNSGFTVGRNDVTIKVSAENGLDERTYLIRVYRLASDEQLYDLTIDGKLYGKFPSGAFVKVLSDQTKRETFKNWTGDVEVIRYRQDYIDCPGMTVEMPNRNVVLGTEHLRTYDVTFKVVDDNGNPKNSAITFLYQTQTPNATTGLVTFRNIPEGRYTWSHDGAGTQSNIRGGMVEVTSNIPEYTLLIGASPTNNGHLPKSEVTVKVTDAANAPITDASVFFNKERLETNAQGEVKFTNIPNAGHTLICGKPGYISDTRHVEIDGNMNFSIILKTFNTTDALFCKASVINGTGGGQYVPGTSFTIKALIRRGMTFDGWTGDIGALASANQSETVMTMGKTNLSVTANYKDDPGQQRELTVIGGTGSGAYIAGDIVRIEAPAERENDEEFDRWTGDVDNVADTGAPSTTITIEENATVTATYKKRTHSITVIDGTADKNSASMGETVTLSPLNNETFKEWEIADGDINIDANNQFTMPPSTVTVKGIYIISIETFGTTKVSVYPNPTEDILYIKGITKDSEYTVFSEEGKALQTGICSEEKPILLKTLTQGIYYLQIEKVSMKILLK